MDSRSFLSSLPDPVRPFAEGARISDSSCSPEARVWFLDKGPGAFLKTSAAGTLKTEALMDAYFHRIGLSSAVLYYGSFGDRDWLVTEKVPGKDCTRPPYRDNPEKLCETTARLLRELHETDPAGCPGKDRLETYKAAVREGIARGSFEDGLFAGIWGFSSFDEARKTAEEGLRFLTPDALIHGDYCLPNILLKNWKLSGYIDLGNAGIADRHIDIFWGIWTLNFNLHTTEYTDRFLDAYGRERVEPEKLRQLAAMEMIGG